MRHSKTHRLGLYEKALMSRPTTSAIRVVFPWDKELKTYSKEEYNPISTEGRISQNDIDNTIEELKKSPHFEIENYWCYTIFGVGIAIIGLILYFIFLFSNLGDDNNDSDYETLRKREAESNKDFFRGFLLGVTILIVSLIISCVLGCIQIKKYKKGLIERQKAL